MLHVNIYRRIKIKLEENDNAIKRILLTHSVTGAPFIL